MATAEKRPNVVVVMTTQWRARATGYGGDGNAATPFIDSLAEESIDFFQAITPHPMGVFARAAFLTGIPCPENGVVDYFDPLPENAVTIAHRFQEGGYNTAFLANGNCTNAIGMLRSSALNMRRLKFPRIVGEVSSFGRVLSRAFF